MGVDWIVFYFIIEMWFIVCFKVLNEKFMDEIDKSMPNMFPDQYFTCRAECLSCRCERSIGHSFSFGCFCILCSYDLLSTSKCVWSDLFFLVAIEVDSLWERPFDFLLWETVWLSGWLCTTMTCGYILFQQAMYFDHESLERGNSTWDRQSTSVQASGSVRQHHLHL